MDSSPKVFISYSHDSDDHRARVRGLSQRLRKDGIDAQIDQYVEGAPDGAWPRWMLDRLDWAEFVLVVCTETYYRRFRGHEEPGKGKGVDWEGALITQQIYDARSKTKKFVAVLFEASDEQFIPEPLRGRGFYVPTSEQGYDALYDVLLEQSGIEPCDIGTPRRKPRERGKPASFRPPPPASCQVGPSRLPRMAGDTLVGREKELAYLHEAWQSVLEDRSPRARIVTLVAWGGVGKTALVSYWMDQLAADGWKGTERVFEWSFYSQGTREQSGASSDTFIKEALTFFGDAKMAESNASASDKGARLGELVGQATNLLVLDGVEPLQHPPGQQAGWLKDPALAALLAALARRGGRGLCVVTTRETVTDLKRFHGTTAPEWKLDHLSEPAGARLLRSLGVKGSGSELKALSRDLRGHALTLELMASYLAKAHGGDIRKRDEVELEEADAEVQGGHAFKVMVAYEKWLESGGERGKQQLALLRLMGFFDRPADPGCIRALRLPPAIQGLTEPLVELRDTAWNLLVGDLEQAGLVTTSEYEPIYPIGFSEEQSKKPASERGAPERFAAKELLRLDGARVIDVHPLTREHFGRQLRQRSVEAFREGHRRVYEHLKASVPYWPEGTQGLQPLYQAVAHGCQARLHQEACDRVYYDRIQRRKESYSFAMLGAFGAELGAAAWFFEEPWTRVVASLSEADQGWLLAVAAFGLRALGRMTEALGPVRAALDMAVRLEDWTGAAARASNLSELELTLGNVAAALGYGANSVEYADKSGDASQRMGKRARFADARHHAGNRSAALALFREAEAIQAERQPAYPLLLSLPGFWYCDLLLADAERVAWLGVADARLADASRSVVDRATETLQWVTAQGWLLDIALDHLTLGRAKLCLAILDPAEVRVRSAARDRMNAAVDGLHASGDQSCAPRGLLSRAWLRALDGDLGGARADLDEAWEIAERGSMRLFMADVHLYRARLFHDRAELAEARRLITELGYGRRKEELEDAERAAKGWNG